MAVQNGDSEQAMHLRAIRGGYGVFLASQAVVYVTVIAVRYLMAYGRVGPYSQGLGAVITLAMIISVLATRSSRAAVKNGDLGSMAGRLMIGTVLGLAAFVLVLIQWVNLRASGLPVTTPTLEVYFTLTGFWLLYALIGIFLLVAARSRGLRVGYTPDNHWDLDAATYMWEFVTIAWVVSYVVLYFA